MIDIVTDAEALAYAGKAGNRTGQYDPGASALKVCLEEIRRRFPSLRDCSSLSKWCRDNCAEVFSAVPFAATLHSPMDGFAVYAAPPLPENPYVLDIEAVCAARPEIYAAEYRGLVFAFAMEIRKRQEPERYADRPSQAHSLRENYPEWVVSDAWEFLSIGREMPEDDEELLFRAVDLVEIWDFVIGEREWMPALAHYKAGHPEKRDAALDAGVDIAIETYFSGVPLDAVLGTAKF